MNPTKVKIQIYEPHEYGGVTGVSIKKSLQKDWPSELFEK